MSLTLTLTALGAPVLAPAVQAQALPSLGEIDGFTVGDERRLGDYIAAQLYRDPAYVDDPVLQEYVESIWQSLMTAAQKNGALGDTLGEQFAWKVLLGKDRSVNAFALPGGYFGLHLGLINVVDSKDELASVMAHEMTHVTQRHISRMMAQNARQTPLIIAGMILGALAASQSPDAAQAVITGGHALAIQNQLDFSRAMEQEADRVGFGLMAPAGFDPAGFVGMFDKLTQANHLNDSGAYPYLRSHPLTTQRRADMQARIPQGRRYVTPPLKAEHAMIVARSRAISLGNVDAQRTAMDAASHALAQGVAPVSAAELAGRLYGGIYAAAQLRDFAQARQWLRALQEATQADAAAQRLAQLLELEVALQAKDADWVRQAYDAIDTHTRLRPELFLRTQAVVEGFVSDDGVIADWQSWLVSHPQDAGAWQQLARLWHGANQPLRAIRAEAEAQAARFDYNAAIDRLKAGLNMVRSMGAQADHVDASILQSRLAAMEQAQRDYRQGLERFGMGRLR
ncbi:hypothetical protein AAV94_01310 [Lampropedia cohaerens]|uniref:Peptidase M48 domain-containing protein n=1 Tax=Lampropedia cohaerens TaxID=1610491 RepID=A0A0U1Q372_9BURK|nr:hypothetical protein AAV94_01310 [Lampropedia cohaerens]